MNSFFKTAALFFFLTPVAGAQTIDIPTGHEMKRIAYSAKAGVEVFAEAENGRWCDDILSLKVFAQDEAAFEEPLLNALMAKVAVVLKGECPSAQQAVIDGYSSNTLVYQGSASAADKWKTEKGTLKVKIRQLQAAAVASARPKDGFPVREWTPPAGKQKIMAHIDQSALEYRLYSKDKRCSVFYTTDKPAAKMKNWFISVGGNSCSENLVYGRAEVSVFNDRDNLETTLDGYFTEGRFTGRKNLNVVLLNRYGAGRDEQVVSYLIDSDPELKIHYVGYLKSRRNRKTGLYSPWAGCAPFTIAAVTENEELFLEQAVTDNILRTAESFADIFCSGATRMRFFATTVPQGIAGMDMPENVGRDKEEDADSKLIYAAVLERKPAKKWTIASDKTQNLARLRENIRRNEDLREHQLMMADYNELTKADYLGRLAYMIGVDRIDNLPAMLTASSIIQKPVRVNLLVNIASSGLDKAWVEWPSEFLITQASGLLSRQGWHIVSGNLRAMTAEERKKYKKDKPFTAGVLELSAAAACEQEACGEVADLVGLIRRRHEKPNWRPYHAPYRQEDEP